MGTLPHILTCGDLTQNSLEVYIETPKWDHFHTDEWDTSVQIESKITLKLYVKKLEHISPDMNMEATPRNTAQFFPRDASQAVVPGFTFP